MILKNVHAPINILLAEDDPDDRSFFTKALNEIPMATQLITVRDGEQLMTYLGGHLEQLPDVLFLDLSMPRKTGYECLTEIKEDDKLKGIPVIVLTTSLGRVIDFEQGMIDMLSHIGSQEYIRKPGDYGQLKQLIHKILMVIEKKLFDASNMFE